VENKATFTVTTAATTSTANTGTLKWSAHWHETDVANVLIWEASYVGLSLFILYSAPKGFSPE